MKNSDYKLSSWWVTGFTDGDGCFTLGIDKSSSGKVGYNARLGHQLVSHSRDKNTLDKIKVFFGNVGRVYYGKDKRFAYYTVNKLDDIVNIIIPQFNKYPLQSKKIFLFVQ